MMRGAALAHGAQGSVDSPEAPPGLPADDARCATGRLTCRFDTAPPRSPADREATRYPSGTAASPGMPAPAGPSMLEPAATNLSSALIDPFLPAEVKANVHHRRAFFPLACLGRTLLVTP